ncbi:MAG: CPBP family intramembrane metalloprotease [Chloroflexota bacterium]|nr:MAG: CPBP family intramembrane metalloprotease [Chloroflexota bacterium]
MNRNSTDEIGILWRWRDLILILLGTFLFLVVGVVLFVTIELIRGVKPEDLMQVSVAQTIWITALEAIALTAGVYFFGLKRKGFGWDVVGLRSTSPYWYFIAIIATLVIIPIISLVTILVFYLIGEPLENPQLDFLLPEGLSTLDALLMLILAGFAAPFGEELLFRGVLYRMFRERWGIWIGIFLSSLLFGIIHGNFAVAITGFIIGVVAAIAFEYSRSLWTAIIIHAINNSLKIGLLYLLVKLGISI